MERLKQRVVNARKALKTLTELLGLRSLTVVERDAAIQRFEYTFEAVWKAGKAFLREIEGLEIGSPKGVKGSKSAKKRIQAVQFSICLNSE